MDAYCAYLPEHAPGLGQMAKPGKPCDHRLTTCGAHIETRKGILATSSVDPSQRITWRIL